MNPTSVAKELKANEDEEHTKKLRCSVSLNGAVKYTLKSSLIALKPHYRPLYGVVSILIALSILTDGVAIMAL